MAEHGPSEKATEAAAKATAYLNREGVGNPGPDFFSTPYARAALVAAHDPALGLDRSVNARSFLAEIHDVLKWDHPAAAHQLQTTFPAESSSPDREGA